MTIDEAVFTDVKLKERSTWRDENVLSGDVYKVFLDISVKVGNCIVCCRDKEMDVVLFRKPWNMADVFEERFSTEKTYQFIIAVQSKEQFWIPMHEDDIEVSDASWFLKPAIHFLVPKNFSEPEHAEGVIMESRQYRH